MELKLNKIDKTGAVIENYKIDIPIYLHKGGTESESLRNLIIFNGHEYFIKDGKLELIESDVTITHKISLEELSLLSKINDNGYAEYRDRSESLSEFKKTDTFINGFKSEQSFLNRNFGGTYYLLNNLFEFNLIVFDEESWHKTVIVTELGKKVISENINKIK